MSAPTRPRGPTADGVDAALAALATLAAAWPISTVLAEPTWLRGAILLLAVIAGSGFGARSLALRGWHVLTVQLVCSILAASAIYGQGHLWHGLPTLRTVRFADGLVHEAIASAQKYAAPAPATPGLIFVVGCALGLAALAVDYLAVTRHSPSMAGLPLLTVFLAAAANQGSTMPVKFFVAAAAMWLILVARAGTSIVRRWATTVAVSQTPVRQPAGPYGEYQYASAARALGVAALLAAMAVPVVLPQLPPTFLRSGLGRSSSTVGNGSQALGFEQSLDLANDLRNPSRAPVLQYTTADAAPPPLRVAVGSHYQSDPGVWLPWGRPWGSSTGRVELSANPRVPGPTGLSSEVPRRTFAMEVSHNRLEDPLLAVPYPLIGADLGGIAWGADYETQSVRVAARPDAYTARYAHLDPTPTMLRDAPLLSDQDRTRFDLDLTLDGPSGEMVDALTERLTAGKVSTFDKAMAIQEYLRSDGGFTYSLTLAPPAQPGLDSLTNFLVTKQGYCVQFATAMVMMSRAAGIPARMDLGFLPGTKTKGVWTVIAADAHAWPELYFDGIGWTRFEPTPSREAPPGYAVPAVSPGTADSTPAPGTATAPVPGRATPKDLGAPATGDGAAPAVGASPGALLRWLTHGWGSVLLGALILLLGSLVVPAAALWHRRRSLSKAHTAAARIELQWELLTSSLGDLGIAPAPSRTPRQLRTYYDREALLEGAASQALGRVVQTLERSRYTEPAPDSDGLRPDDGLTGDAQDIVRAAAATRQGSVRLRAALWPSSGITALRSARAGIARHIRAPIHHMSQLIRRR